MSLFKLDSFITCIFRLPLACQSQAFTKGDQTQELTHHAADEMYRHACASCEAHRHRITRAVPVLMHNGCSRGRHTTRTTCQTQSQCKTPTTASWDTRISALLQHEGTGSHTVFPSTSDKSSRLLTMHRQGSRIHMNIRDYAMFHSTTPLNT